VRPAQLGKIFAGQKKKSSVNVLHKAEKARAKDSSEFSKEKG